MTDLTWRVKERKGSEMTPRFYPASGRDQSTVNKQDCEGRV